MFLFSLSENEDASKIDRLPMIDEFIKISRFDERFWLQVIFVDKQNRMISGVIDNDLVKTSFHGLKCGEVVTFHASEIIEFLNVDAKPLN